MNNSATSHLPGQIDKSGVLQSAPPQKIYSRPRKGRGFFLTLLIASGLIILFLLTLFLKGREITIFTLKRFVVNKAFVTLLPEAYTLEKAEQVRKTVYDFFDDTRSDAAILQVSRHMQEMMQDEKVTDAEVISLLQLIEKVQKPKEAADGT